MVKYSEENKDAKRLVGISHSVALKKFDRYTTLVAPIEHMWKLPYFRTETTWMDQTFEAFMSRCGYSLIEVDDE